VVVRWEEEEREETEGELSSSIGAVCFRCLMGLRRPNPLKENILLFLGDAAVAVLLLLLLLDADGSDELMRWRRDILFVVDLNERERASVVVRYGSKASFQKGISALASQTRKRGSFAPSWRWW